MDGTKINCIISAIKRNLKLEVISIILGGIGDFANKLSDVGMSPATLLSSSCLVDEVTVINIFLVSLLSQACDLFLSYLSMSLPPLQLS